MKTRLWCAIVAVVAACSGTSTSAKSSREVSSEGLDPHAKVVRILEEGIGGANPAVVRGLLGETYTQHNPRVPDGPQGLVGFVEGLEQSPERAPRVDVLRTIVDGELAAAHTEYGRRGKVAGFDLFRMEDGRFVEHWDAGQQVPEKTASGRGMLDGPVEITDRDRTAANKELVARFAREVLVGRDVAALATYFDGDRLLQHDPLLEDGVESLRRALSGPPGAVPRHEEVRRVIGEGNFVLVHSGGRAHLGPVVLYDLYRVENGKLAEHWSVFERIPDRAANDNGML